MIEIKKKVLVLDADMVSSLTVARSMKKMGVNVDAASHIRNPIAFASNSVTSVFIYPDPLDNQNAFLEWFADHLQNNKYDLIIPVTERTILPIKKIRKKPAFLSSNFAMSSNESLDIVLDKTRTVAMAKKLNISVPFSQIITHTDQLNKILNDLVFPVVIKPSRSIGAEKDSSIQLSVEYAMDIDKLKSKVSHMLRFGEVILQGFFQGKGVGLEVIADHGTIKYFFQHERLHEVPLSGGGSSLRESVKIIPELKSATIKIMRALKWHGVAMVEFKYNPADRSYAFMEINGRLWGSLPLAIASGADFPKMMYELFVKGAINKHPEPKLGIVCRKLSRDIYWHELVLRKIYQPEVVQLPKYSTVAKDLALMFNPKHRFDVQTCSDLKPSILDVWNIISVNLKRIRDIISEKIFLNRQKKILKSQRVTELLNNAEQLLFICYGNINRSVLAEKIFRDKYSGNKIKCISGGFHKEEGRPADPVMVEVANDIHINLSNHCSRCITKEMIQTSDLIFVMEKKHYDRIIKSFMFASNKIFLLGMFRDDGKMEIDDPYGKSGVEYKICLHVIKNAIVNLIKTFEGKK